MFDKTAINSMYGIVGVRNPFNPAYSIVNADNQISRSGYYVNDNPLCTIQSLKSCQNYVSINDTDFNLMLKRMQETAISSVASQVFNESDLIQRDLIYSNSLNKVNTESLPTGFVGYKITLDNCNDVAFELKRVILEFDGTGSFDLLLFNTGSKTALKTKTIAITSDSQVEVLDWKLDNSANTYKGDFYVGYINSGLTINPFKRDYDLSGIKTSFNNLYIQNVAVEGHLTANLFDLNNVDYADENIGLNFDITVYKDFTDLLINTETIFSKAILLTFQINFLSVYVASIRKNGEKRETDNLVRIIQEVEGQTGSDVKLKITGLKPLLIKEISFIKNEINKLRDNFDPYVINNSLLG